MRALTSLFLLIMNSFIGLYSHRAKVVYVEPHERKFSCRKENLKEANKRVFLKKETWKKGKQKKKKKSVSFDNYMVPSWPQNPWCIPHCILCITVEEMQRSSS